MGKRRKFSSEFKHRVVIEAIKEQLTMSELGAKYDLHPNVITKLEKRVFRKEQRYL